MGSFIKKFLVGSLTALFLVLFAVGNANAGGGPVALTAFPLRPFDQTKTFILQVEIYANQSCSELQPVVVFKDSKDSDSVTAYTPPDDGTYITRHYNTGQPNFAWKEICDFYYQAKSSTTEQRTATVSVVVDGKTQERTTLIAYGEDYYSKQLQGFGRVNDYDNTPQPDVVSERYLGGPKREVKLHWQKIPWAAKYTVFAREVTSNGKEPAFSVATTQDTNTTINLAAFSEFYISAIACKIDDPCTNSKDETYSFLLPKMHNVNISSTENNSITRGAQITPQEMQPSVNTSANEETIEELNKKVAQLEGKLEESGKRQGILEQRINDLVEFIKRLFPLFQ